MVDPLKGSPWSAPGTVAGFAEASPNPTLMEFAAAERPRGARALEIGCGAARNALPLAQSGWDVLGTDLSWPMLEAALRRAGSDPSTRGRLQFLLAPMEALPVRDGAVDFVVAHGIWNLAASSAQFRRAVAEAARVAREGAALFVFTFSRTTLPPDVRPISGEPFVFTEFSGEPQCFLTEAQLMDELGAAGFVPDAAVPLREHNAPPPGTVRRGGPPVIYEAAFRRRGR